VIAGTFRMSGSTGTSQSKVNGVFEPTNEFQNDFPVYRKKGDSDLWIELVYGGSGWRWYLKPTANKGPDSSICFAYLQCDGIDVKLPHQCTSKWFVHTSGSFVEQNVVMTAESSLPLPENIVTRINEGLEKMEKKRSTLLAEAAREPFPGAFSIEGATGKVEARINGVYEPTIESQSGFPIYRKKGDDDTWIEIVYTVVSGWRWYLKPTANKGPNSSMCFAYANCKEDKVLLPGDLSVWSVSTNEGFVEQKSVKVTRVGGTDPPDVCRCYDEGLAVVRKTKENQIAEESRTPNIGSFLIEGATGQSAVRINGVFEPTTEVQNGMPVYQKKGDPDTWIELVHGKSGWRWYLKPTLNKGPDSSICFMYFTHDGKNCKLPPDCKKPWYSTGDDLKWYVSTSAGFKAQSTVKVTYCNGSKQPDYVTKLLKEEKWKTLK